LSLKGKSESISRAIRWICDLIIDEEGKDMSKNKNGINKRR
jgi:hypothetical protein